MMRTLSSTNQKAIDELVERHGFSRDAVASMLESVVLGYGTMAQFDHPEFGGRGQWMDGGITMVSDLFNDSLERRVAALGEDLSKVVENKPAAAEPVSLFAPSRRKSSDRIMPKNRNTLP